MSCAACFSGSAQTGTPTGTYSHLHGYKTYTAQPNSPHPSGSTILYLPDFFSHRLVNNALLCDRYAALTGCTVIFPDIVRKGGADPSWLPVFEVVMGEDKQASWWWKLWCYAQMVAMIPQFLFGMPESRFGEVLRYARAVRRGMPDGAKFGVAGFCWGGYGSAKLCTQMREEGGTERLVDAHFSGHPSKLETPKDVVEAVGSGVPFSVAVAEIDFMFDKAKSEETEAKLRQMFGSSGNGEGKPTWELRVHPGAYHGFCVRAKEGVKADEEGREAALQQAAEWFKRYLL